MAPYIGELLDAGIPLLVYNGDRDMTTNMVGTEMVLNTRLEWRGKEGWQDAPRGLWKTDYRTATEYTGGWAKEHGGLTFVVVYNSGHMYVVCEILEILVFPHSHIVSFHATRIKGPLQRARPRIRPAGSLFDVQVVHRCRTDSSQELRSCKAQTIGMDASLPNWYIRIHSQFQRHLRHIFILRE
jgi:hypothetical protein